MNTSPSHAPHRVLIVDDDEIEREMLVELLTAPNRLIEAFAAARPALDYVRQHPVDLALLDHVMPGMSGADLAEQIKLIYPQSRVVMCTGYLIESGHPKIRQQADHVLHKPLNLGELLSLVNADALK